MADPPGGMGTPGGIGLPTLPGEDPYDIDQFGKVDDPNDWQLWWMFNRDRFLNLAGINAGAVYSGSDGFYLGDGTETGQAHAGRLNDQLIDAELVPALKASITAGGSYDFIRSAMLSIAKLGGERPSQFGYVTDFYLRSGDVESMPTAAFVRGMTGGASDARILREIALDTVKGCEAITPKDERTTPRVPVAVRAFACYGLGMIGSRTTDVELKREVVKTLIEVVENDASDANDARVAAMIAIGLVPLPVDEDVVACYCGTCVVPDPHTSLRPQVTYLMRYFTAEKEFDPVLRAHTATTLGRLVAARPAGMTDRMKEGVAEVLVRSLAQSSRQPENVRESAVLALGLIGDADEDNLDQWIRWAIRRSIKNGEDMERRFALIALAETGGHKGQGDEPFAALPEIRGVLQRAATGGKRGERAWAAIAAGVLGFELRCKGEPLDEALDTALVNTIRRGKKVEDLGAFAIAAGLRRSEAALPHLTKRLPKVKDEAAAGYVGMAIGLIGDDDEHSARSLLRETFADAEGKPLLQTRVGLGLGFLRDPEVVDTLLVRLGEIDEATEGLDEDDDKDAEKATEFEAERAAIVTALGYLGDRRGLSKLIAIAQNDAGDEPDSVREAAMQSLGYLGDASRRPWRIALTMGANYRAQTSSLTTADGGGVLDLR